MRICHLCMNGPYNDGWNYQENILPKYHAKQGHEVYQLVTRYMWDGNEQIIYDGPSEYVNEYGVHIIRLKEKKGLIGGARFNRYPEVLNKLDEILPDILFIHDVQCLDMKSVATFLKHHPFIITYADNHSDFSNSARNFISSVLLHRIIWRHTAQTINPYVKKFYGVLPARVDFLHDMYGIPSDKIELLVMGADDELVNQARNNIDSKNLRKKHNIDKDDFLIVTGGKIDSFKKQTLNLMEAVRNINDSRVKLLVFGSVAPELFGKVTEFSDGNLVQYIGWIDAKESYDYFAISDLVVFPGRHSVFWEQVVGQGIPMLVKDWPGTHHVDLGGNVGFLKEDSTDEIQTKILELVNDKDKYDCMKTVAQSKGMECFSYDNIAKKSIIG